MQGGGTVSCFSFIVAEATNKTITTSATQQIIYLIM